MIEREPTFHRADDRLRPAIALLWAGTLRPIDKEVRMKKNKTRGPEHKQKPRRLSLNRETIVVLNDPALLELVRGAEQRMTDCPTLSRSDAGG